MKILEKYQSEINKTLEIYFQSQEGSFGEKPEKELFQATKEALLNGGKRIRPVLGLLCFDLLVTSEKNRKQVLEVLLSLEFLHAYSLVHDDLPALDNDVLRRGKPTIWKKYGESTALLVGDLLNTLAFENLAQKSPKHCLKKLVNILSSNSGINGMIGGQMRDLFFENQDFTLEQLIETHRKKTGTLIMASAQFGAVLAQASEANLNHITKYAQTIGLAFQVKDDLLDVEGDELMVGKKVRKDIDSKGFIKLLGLEATKKYLKNLTKEAVEIAQTLQSKELEQLAIFIEEREK